MALLNEKTVPIGLRRTLSEAPARHWRAAGFSPAVRSSKERTARTTSGQPANAAPDAKMARRTLARTYALVSTLYFPAYPTLSIGPKTPAPPLPAGSVRLFFCLFLG